MVAQKFAARLASRGVVQVAGKDSLRFLQGLVTNDVHALCSSSGQNTSFSCFLNGRGRVLVGAFMHRLEDSWYLLDVPASRVDALVKHMRQYRLRAAVDIDDVTDQHSVWAIQGSEPNLEKLATEHGVVYQDPRLPDLGKRAIFEHSFTGFTKLRQESEDTYEVSRFLTGVPDGDDFVNTPLPLDLAMHLLNGVSFNKGCYLGQELTARSHFTGVLRKRIAPLIVTSEKGTAGEFKPASHVSHHASHALEKGTELFIESKAKPIGKVSSSIKNLGLAVIRLSDVFGKNDSKVSTVRLGDGRTARIWTPWWWAERETGVANMET